ncbi:vacuolar transporter chaperone [Gonapodya sp. JEL0774]|nr:vacuolar transporter chaperone [Gonapodya sp. JEL0774]
MKFGKELEEEIQNTPTWAQYYINYTHLKTLLKEDPVSDDEEESSAAQAVNASKKKNARTPLEPEEDQAFIEELDKELEKITSTYLTHKGLLRTRLDHLIDLVASSPVPPDFRTIADVQGELDATAEEARRLGLFTRLNYTGVLKILKKHDKLSNYKITSTYQLRLASTGWSSDELRVELVDLSRCFDQWNTLRNGGRTIGSATPQRPLGLGVAQHIGIPREGHVEKSLATLQVEEPSEGVVKKTFKYWVHQILIFTDKSRSDDIDTSVLTVYFDDDDCSTYNDLAANIPAVQVVRIKWVGQKPPQPHQEVTVELQESGDTVRRDMPVRYRFSVKEKYLVGFLDGSWSYTPKIDKWRKNGTHGTTKELDELERTSRRVQDAILKRRLRPVLRTAYKRTAFQVPGQENVVASLDTEIKMVREDDFGGKERAGKGWIRKDAAWPYQDLVDQNEAVKFAPGVLEIRVVYPVGGHPPEWVRGLLNTGLVLETPSFSKYVHGISQLIPSKCAVLPFWATALQNIDIRHPSGAVLGPPAAEDEHNTWRADRDDDDEDDELDEEAEEDDESDEEHSRTISSTETSKPSSGTAAPHNGAVHAPNAPWSVEQWLGEMGKAVGLVPTADEVIRRPVLGKASTGPKRVAIPVRIEPKVYFANERTLLDWLSFSTVIGGLALGLLNFGDPVGQTMGMLFTVVTLAIMWYACGIYIWRLHKIQSRDASPYDDRVGPAALVVCLFICLFVNFYLRYKDVIDGAQP